MVEAKRTMKSAQAGQEQAKLYADALEAKFGQRPIIFYTNGYETWIWDDLRYPPRAVQGFYTKDELDLLIQRRASRQAAGKGVAINDEIVEPQLPGAGDPAHRRGLRAAAAAQALLVMATGTGKTRTAIALVDLLIRANWVKRVLFLADRKALVTQAVNAFKTHLPGVPTSTC